MNKFKVGDRVKQCTWIRNKPSFDFGFTTKHEPGTIIALTPSGYTVNWDDDGTRHSYWDDDLCSFSEPNDILREML